MQSRPLILGLGAATLAASLSACLAAPIALITWSAQTGFGHIGTSVVCLGSDQGPQAAGMALADGSFLIQGQVVSEEPGSPSGNVDACWSQASRTLTIVDEGGIEWQVGYRWQSESLGDVTPTIKVEPGESVELRYRSGALEGAAGFAVYHQEDGLLYAMESGRGGPGLAQQDVPEIQVERGEAVATEQLECGAVQAQTMLFLAESGDEAELGPGGDAPMRATEDGYQMTLCNINAVETAPACEGEALAQTEHSWVIFNPR